jgi:hypothetical protein
VYVETSVAIYGVTLCRPRRVRWLVRTGQARLPRLSPVIHVIGDIAAKPSDRLAQSVIGGAMLQWLSILLAAFIPVECRVDTNLQQWFTSTRPAAPSRANLTVGSSWEALGPFPMSVVNGIFTGHRSID